ncbi:MAG: hypothetical protein Q4B96_02535 [Bacillota bacterium]|nr:hypothetical protein [Bacillota bacterium]
MSEQRVAPQDELLAQMKKQTRLLKALLALLLIACLLLALTAAVYIPRTERLLIELEQATQEMAATAGQVDVETLNEAISDLQQIIQPIAELFGGR